MKTFDLKASARQALSKKQAAEMRKNEQVPCTIYGNGDNVLFTVEKAALKNLIYTPSAYLVNIDIEGKKELGVMREQQFHPVSDEILHIDFYRVDASKPIAIDIPVVLKGSAEGVKKGGKLQQAIRKVRVSALSKDLPDTLEVDITSLDLGKTIFVGDVNFANVNILTPKSAAICAVKMTRAAMGAAASAAAANAPAAAKKK
ncbi:MAG: 50S ribosomal protein L25/general stress protein Ctc [Prevotellaceae bacterium]|jgi:large subunit ribosomal protein L25|nr:50S ribosomal protein L25/general stress protein Ctc [Prevotellaceae bacterium]